MALTFADALRTMRELRDECRKRPEEEQIRFLQFCLENVADTRSQFFQDLWVAWELKSPKTGFFVEFGAANGLHASNTAYLEKHLGWRGILAEPARFWYPYIYRLRGCFIDQRAVYGRSGERVAFIQPAIAQHSTIEAFAGGDYAAETRKEGERYEVETVSLNDLLTHWGAPRRIDYISVDTEGSEVEILKTFDFDRWDVRLMTIEHAREDTKRARIHDLMTAAGYRRKFENISGDDDWYFKTY